MAPGGPADPVGHPYHVRRQKMANKATIVGVDIVWEQHRSGVRRKFRTNGKIWMEFADPAVRFLLVIPAHDVPRVVVRAARAVITPPT